MYFNLIFVNFIQIIMTQETIANYKTLLENISTLIDISGYRNDFIAKKLGIKPANFSIKKQRTKWTPDEVSNILTLIENEETEDYCLGLLMNNADKKDVLSLQEFKDEIGWK